MIWELAGLYGLNLKTAKEFLAYSKELKAFAELEPCKNALKGVSAEWLPEAKHKLFVGLLKNKMYSVSIMLCFVFYKILKK